MIQIEVAKYLGANVAGLTYDAVGATGNVFVGFMPESPAEAVAVMSSGGEKNDTKLGYGTPAIQILVRGGTAFDRTAGFDLAEAIYSALVGLTSTAFPDGTFVVLVQAGSSSPADIGADENGFQEWSTNFLFEVRDLTLNRE